KNHIQFGRFDSRMAERFDLEILADALNIERDELFTYAGLDGLLKRYAVRNQKDQSPAETPQYFFMRVAMGLSYNGSSSKGGPTEMAIKFYNKMSRMEYIAGGSTNLDSGMVKPA